MASMWRRAAVYLGLVDDDEYEDYDPYEETAMAAPVAPGPASAAPPQVRRTAMPGGEVEAGMVRTLPREAVDPSAVQPRPAVVRPLPATQTAKVHVVAPGGFNDAQEIGDKLKTNQPVIMNLQGSNRDLSRRLIDFASGLAYGLGGQMERVADQVFLLTPTNVEVSAEERRRLQERGLYQA
jgi:cell division inhibitor SepF